MNQVPTHLICNRLSDMTKMHPKQDDTHKCHECGHQVGIYPSGQRSLQRWPDMKIICAPCIMAIGEPLAGSFPAAESRAEFEQESRESKPVIRQ